MIFEGTEIFQASLTLVDPFIPTIIIVSPSLVNISIEDDESKSTPTLQYAMAHVFNECYSHNVLSTTSFLTMVNPQMLSLGLKWKSIQFSNRMEL